MIVGGYSLHLYCDGERHAELHPEKYGSLDAEFAGRNESDCMGQARRKGWTFRAGKCICRKCKENRK